MKDVIWYSRSILQATVHFCSLWFQVCLFFLWRIGDFSPHTSPQWKQESMFGLLENVQFAASCWVRRLSLPGLDSLLFVTPWPLCHHTLSPRSISTTPLPIPPLQIRATSWFEKTDLKELAFDVKLYCVGLLSLFYCLPCSFWCEVVASN